MKKAGITFDFSVPSHGKSSEVPQPSDWSFYNPSSPVSPQLSSILIGSSFVIATGRDDRFDSSFLECFSNFVTVVTSISNKPFRSTSWSSRTRTFYFDGFECFFKELDLRRGRRVQVCSQRSTRAIDQYHPLCSLPTFGLTPTGSPFFAGTKLPSTKHSFHRSLSSSWSWVKKDRHNSRSVPSCSHCCSRLQQVLELLYSFGTSLHGAPVQRTQRIPSKHFLSSTGGRPPFGRRGCGGRCTLIFSHCLSVRCLQLIIPSS